MNAATARALPIRKCTYLDKFTLFAKEADMADSKNDGFAVIDKEAVTAKIRFFGKAKQPGQKDRESSVPFGLLKVIEVFAQIIVIYFHKNHIGGDFKYL